MLRVNRLAAAMDIIADGTSAPMTMVANATPANQCGKTCSNSSGMIVLVLALPPAVSGLMFAASATRPSSAISASTTLYSGSQAIDRLTVSRDRVVSTPVIACG